MALFCVKDVHRHSGCETCQRAATGPAQKIRRRLKMRVRQGNKQNEKINSFFSTSCGFYRHSRCLLVSTGEQHTAKDAGVESDPGCKPGCKSGRKPRCVALGLAW